MAYAGYRAKQPTNPIDDAIAALMVVAEGDDEEAAQARKMLAAHFGGQKEKAKARAAARSSFRVVQASTPSLSVDEAREVHHQAVADADEERLAALTPHQRQMLEKLNRHPGASRARAEGTALILEPLTEQAAAQRVRELEAQGVSARGTNVELLANSRFAESPFTGRR